MYRSDPVKNHLKMYDAICINELIKWINSTSKLNSVFRPLQLQWTQIKKYLYANIFNVTR